MDPDELTIALRAALQERLKHSDAPQALLTQAEGELAQWARLPPSDQDAAEILAVVREVVTEERKRFAKGG